MLLGVGTFLDPFSRVKVRLSLCPLLFQFCVSGKT